MADRVHMTAPDGRTFTFEEWCDYDLHNPGDDTLTPYVTQTGEVFDVDGFRFNVHGHCLNAHKILIAPANKRLDGVLCYIELRTWREWKDFQHKTPVWCVDTFSINAPQICWISMGPEDTEQDAIVAGLRSLRKEALHRIGWCKESIESAKINGITDTTYGGEMKRYRAMLKLIDAELENKMQLTLF